MKKYKFTIAFLLVSFIMAALAFYDSAPTSEIPLLLTNYWAEFLTRTDLAYSFDTLVQLKVYLSITNALSLGLLGLIIDGLIVIAKRPTV